MMVLLEVCVNVRKPWTNVRLICVSLSRLARKPSTLNSSRPSALNTRSTLSKFRMPNYLEHGPVFARSTVRGIPEKLWAAPVSSSQNMASKARAFMSLPITSRIVNVSIISQKVGTPPSSRDDNTDSLD